MFLAFFLALRAQKQAVLHVKPFNKLYVIFFRIELTYITASLVKKMVIAAGTFASLRGPR